MARKDFNRKGRREGPKDRKANRVAGSLHELCAAVALFLGEMRLSEVGCLWRLGKHFHIQIGKEGLVQSADHIEHYVFFDDECQIDLRCALGNHANLYI